MSKSPRISVDEQKHFNELFSAAIEEEIEMMNDPSYVFCNYFRIIDILYWSKESEIPQMIKRRAKCLSILREGDYTYWKKKANASLFRNIDKIKDLLG